jgi:hypothetical protein
MQCCIDASMMEQRINKEEIEGNPSPIRRAPNMPMTENLGDPCREKKPRGPTTSSSVACS